MKIFGCRFHYSCFAMGKQTTKWWSSVLNNKKNIQIESIFKNRVAKKHNGAPFFFFFLKKLNLFLIRHLLTGCPESVLTPTPAKKNLSSTSFLFFYFIHIYALLFYSFRSFWLTMCTCMRNHKCKCFSEKGFY